MNRLIPRPRSGKRSVLVNLLLALAIAALVLTTARRAVAAATPGQILPVATYSSVPGEAFGLAYDSVNDLMWVAPNSGDHLMSFKAFKNYTAAEIAAFPIGAGGVPTISCVGANPAQMDAFQTVLPLSSSFVALAFDPSTGQLVANGGLAPNSGQSADPKTSLNPNLSYRPGFFPSVQSPVDGLDIGPAGLWLGEESSDIFLEGVTFVSMADPSKRAPGFAGGWHGVAQIRNFIYSIEDIGGSADFRTITKHDITTGDLIAYDPDGDPTSQRWEDIAFDGRFLYAASLGNGIIDVFDLSGGLSINEFELSPLNATNNVGSSHTVCATITVTTDGVTSPVVGTTVTFVVTSGPNAGITATSVTDSNGVACFTYTGTGGPGTDTIEASFVDSDDRRESATASKVWVQRAGHRSHRHRL